MMLKETIAIVTGAAQGIGKGIAMRLVREGASVLVADVQAEGAQQTAREIEALVMQAMPYQIDLAEVAQIQRLIELTIAHFGRLDILTAPASCKAKRCSTSRLPRSNA